MSSQTPPFLDGGIRPDSVRPDDTKVTEHTPVAWTRVFAWLLPYWRAEVLLLVGMAVGIGLSLVYPLLMREIVDDVVGLQDTRRLVRLALWILAATAGGVLLSGAAAWLQTWVTARVLVDLRMSCYRHLQDLGPAWFARRRLGDVLSRMGGDLNELQSVATGTLLQVLGSAITLVAVVVALGVLQPLLLAIAAAFAPLALILLWIVRPVIRRMSLRIRERNADISHHMLEGFVALRAVKAHGLEGREATRFEDHNNALVRAVLLLRLWNSGSGGLFQILVTTNLLLVLVVGVHLITAGHMTVGDLVAFVMFQQRLYGPLQGLAGTWINLQRAAAPVARVFEILDARPELDRPGGRTPETILGRLEFDRVGFSYGPGREVLRDVSFTVEPGRTVAVVGPSGVGKSTLIDLTFRFLLPHSGEVRLDGIPLREVDLPAVLPRLALVGQQPALFDASLRDNLRWLEPHLEDPAVLAIVSRVGLEDFVASLPDGLDTRLGDRGVRLSEGQRQRIGLARALLRRPALLVLDEVTSALDWESDRLVVEALDERRGAGGTTLIITHRLHLAAAADRVVVLDDCAVVQEGRHEDLVQGEGLYARLWALQTGGRHRAEEE